MNAFLNIIFFCRHQTFCNSHGFFRCKNPSLLFFVIENHVVNARRFGFSGSSKSNIHPGQSLNFQRNMFYHVSHPGSHFYSFEESTFATFRASVGNKRRQKFFNPFSETVYFVGREMFCFFQIQTHLN
ncbi:hypothetical protein D3C86_1491650 [compost metagenome]